MSALNSIKEAFRDLGIIPNIPLLLDFSKEWHKELLNTEEIGAEIVDLDAEGISKPYAWQNKALKITLNAGETKYLSLPFSGLHEEQQLHILMYLTGDVIAEANTGYTGNKAAANIQNSWQWLITRLNAWSPQAIKFTATNGGNAYIACIILPKNPETLTYQNNPNQTLDGTATYNYYAILPHHGKAKGIARAFARIAGDGTNAINVNVYVLCATDNTYKLVASFSRVSSSTGLSQVKFPYKMFSEPPNDIQFIHVKFEVSGYGTFQTYGLSIWKYDELVLGFNGKVTASASEISTTPVNYVLIDNNGRGNRYKNLKANITIASGGGSVELLVNGKSIGTWTTSGTVDLSFLEDVDIWKIEANIAGDGTNASSVDIEGIELLGAYIVRR